MPSLYPLIMTVAVAGGLVVVYEKYFAERVEDWVSDYVARRRESRGRRRVPIPSEAVGGGDENVERKSWERERELVELEPHHEREEGRGVGSGWERYPGQLDGGVRRRVASGGGGGGGGGGLRGARRDDEVDFDTLLKHSAGGAPPPTQILFSYSQPSSPLPPTSKALPPPPPPSKSPLLPSPTPAQLQLPLSPTPSHRPQLPSSPPSMSTSWAHLPPSASLLLPATDDMLTLRSGSTGLLGGSRVGGGEAAHETESVSSWMSAGPAGDGNMEGSDVESVWSMEDASEEEGWSDVGGVGDEKGR